MTAYANPADVEARISRTLTEAEREQCEVLLQDAAVMIDAAAACASVQIKRLVSCRMVIRVLADSESYPVGASQGSMSGLGYSQSWTMGSGGGAGELYLSKAEKRLLGVGNVIGSHSPVEDMVEGGCNK
jgi:hypothetical protein